MGKAGDDDNGLRRGAAAAAGNGEEGRGEMNGYGGGAFRRERASEVCGQH